jgi:hypothetical protein
MLSLFYGLIITHHHLDDSRNAPVSSKDGQAGSGGFLEALMAVRG